MTLALCTAGLYAILAVVIVAVMGGNRR